MKYIVKQEGGRVKLSLRRGGKEWDGEVMTPAQARYLARRLWEEAAKGDGMDNRVEVQQHADDV